MYQRNGLPLTRPPRNRLATASKHLAWKRPAVPAFAGNVVALDCLRFGDYLELLLKYHGQYPSRAAFLLDYPSRGTRVDAPRSYWEALAEIDLAAHALTNGEVAATFTAHMGPQPPRRPS